MPIYEWRNEETGETREVRISTYDPERTCPGPTWKRIFSSSLLVFGDFHIGDDDFSRRYHLNGAAGANGGKANRTQGTTNVNSHIRKWGKAGRPLELNKDIDTSKSWDTSKGTPPGIDPSTEAPEVLQSSEARGMKANEWNE